MLLNYFIKNKNSFLFAHKTLKNQLSKKFSSNAENLAYYYTENGTPTQVLRFGKPPPGEFLNSPSDTKLNEGVFEVIESPINPSDINMIEGTYPIRPLGPVRIAGSEALGLYRDNPSARPVLALPRNPALGMWRRALPLAPEQVLPLPTRFRPHPLLSAIAVNPSTAYLLLKDFAKLRKGDVVMQNAANSVVGRCVVQFARVFGFKTLNVVRSREGVEEVKAQLRALGADVVLTDAELEDALPDAFVGLGGRPVLGLNAVGGASVKYLSQSLSEGSPLITYGGMSRKPFQVTVSSQVFRDITYRGFWVSRWLAQANDEKRLAMLSEIYDYFVSGELTFGVRRIAFDDSEEVMREISNPTKDVKSVISMAPLESAS